jgi:hypothetical protein
VHKCNKHNFMNVSTSTKSYTSYGIVEFSSNFAALQLGFGIDLLFLYHTLHLTETLSLAVGMVAAGYTSLFNLFYAMALGTKRSPVHLGFTGFPTIARRLIVCVLDKSESPMYP